MPSDLLFRKAIRDTRENWPRLLALMGVIAIGCLTFLSMRAAHHDLVRARDEFYRRCRMADFWVDIKRASLTDLKAIERLPVRDVEYRITEQVRIRSSDDLLPLGALAVSVPAGRRSRVNDVVLMRGSYFEAPLENAVLVNSAFARARGLEPGDRLTVIMGGKELVVRIKGIVTSPEFVYFFPPGGLVPDPERYGILFFPRPLMEDILGFRAAANNIVGRFRSRSPTHQKAVLKLIEGELDRYGVLSARLREQQASHRYLSDEIRGLFAFAIVLASFFLGAAALVLNVLMSRLVDQQRHIIGLLKALGYSDLAVAGHFLAQALALGCGGALTGAVLGELLHSRMMVLYQRFFEFPRLEANLYWHEHALTVFVAAASSALGAWRSVAVALRMAPALAMRPLVPSPTGKVGGRYLNLGSPLTRAAIRYALRHPLRTLIGAASVTVASALLVTSLIGDSSLRYMLSHQYELVERYDLAVELVSSADLEVVAELRRLPGVLRAEPVAAVPVELQHGARRRKTVLLGLVKNSLLYVPRDRKELPVRPSESGLTLSRALASVLGVKEGDTLGVKLLEGERTRTLIPVGRVVDDYVGLACYAPIEMTARMSGTTERVDRVLIRFVPGANRAISLRHIRALGRVQAVRDRNRERTVLRQMVVQLNLAFLLLLMVFAATLLLGSLVNLAFISLSERRREFATMLALGYTPREVSGLLAREIAYCSFLGLLPGLALGYGLAVLMSVIYATEYFRMPVLAPPHVWIIAAGLTAAFGAIAYAFAARSLVRAPWTDWLRVQE